MTIMRCVTMPTVPRSVRLSSAATGCLTLDPTLAREERPWEAMTLPFTDVGSRVRLRTDGVAHSVDEPGHVSDALTLGGERVQRGEGPSVHGPVLEPGSAVEAPHLIFGSSPTRPRCLSGADGLPYRPTFVTSRSTPRMNIFDDNVAQNSMPQSLADIMFGSGHDRLGINLYEYLNASRFGGLHNANVNADRCNL